MATRRNVKRLLARAVALYRAGKLAEAATLFRKVAAAGGDVAVKARLYLERIASKLARTKRAGKRKTAERAKSIKRAKKQSAAKRKAKIKAKREVRHFGGGGGWGGQRKRATRKSGRLRKGGEGAAKTKVKARARRKKKKSVPIGGDREFRAYGSSDIVSRTPHMDIRPQPPLEPGNAFDVEIFVDQQAARAGEDSTKVKVPAGTRVQVNLIVSEHFLIDGPTVQPMTIDGAPRSNAPPFHLFVKPIVQLPAEAAPYISALFMHAGRPCGMVRRAVKIALVDSLDPQR
jgi:hypothetical protein